MRTTISQWDEKLEETYSPMFLRGLLENLIPTLPVFLLLTTVALLL